jgi:hypothetical protein
MNIKKRQEVVNLMPWYNLGKLSDAEKLLVEEALIEDSSLKDELSLDQDIRAKVVAEPDLLNKSAFASSEVRLNNVLAQIDDTVVKSIEKKPEVAVKENVPTVSLFTGVKSFFTDLLSGSSHSFTYAVFAALTVVQLALLLFFVVPSTMQTRAEYSTASGEESKIVPAPTMNTPSDKTSGLVLLVAMEDNIQIEGFISKTLGDIKFDLIPDNYGYYRFRLDRNLTRKEIEVLKNELSHKTKNVIFVGEDF